MNKFSNLMPMELKLIDQHTQEIFYINFNKAKIDIFTSASIEDGKTCKIILDLEKDSEDTFFTLKKQEEPLETTSPIMYNSENWIVRTNRDKNLVISYFSEGHYCGEIVINPDTSKVVYSDDEDRSI